MPTPKQMEKLAAEAARRPVPSAAAPDAPLPAEYWESVLKDPRVGATGAQIRQERLQANFGKAGAYYYWISRGVDNR